MLAKPAIKASWRLAALLVVAVAACSDDEPSDGGLQCPDTQTLCGSQCVDLDSDRLNCGGCGEACGAGQVCSLGGCDTSCADGLTDCSGSCRDLATDRTNCGACGNMCANGEVCAESVCGATCPAGQIACNGACVTTDNDRSHCGACGNACAADEICSDGMCSLFCPGDLLQCGDRCRDVTSDRNHCGACDQVCGPDEQCVDSSCTLACDGAAPDECNGACTDVLTDPTNCGNCGTVCGTGEVCNLGACELQCAPGLAQCGQTCTSTLTDPDNCGDCGISCTTTATGAAGVCIGGGCSVSCLPGLDDCDNDLVISGGNGCETDLTTDVNNCAACGQVCALPNGAAACSMSQCVLTACDSGFDDCNGMDVDGCEVNLASDGRNCGGCGQVCAPLESCQASMCMLTPGENCDSAITLMTGTSTYGWVATNSDYLVGPPSCLPGFTSLTGPDVVFTYTSTINGFVIVELAKPADNRFIFVASGEACGTIAPADELACASNFGATSMTTQFPVSASQDYTLYFNDTASGGEPLPNPLQLTVSTIDCSMRSASVVALSPTSNSTTTSLEPTFQVTFDFAVSTSTGTVRITGDQGTSLSYDLSTSPGEVSFGAGGTVMVIDPGLSFPPGEVLQISWTGVRDALCGNPIASPSWRINVVTPPCAPGVNGVVGRTTRRVSTTISVGPEYYVAADTSTSGYVYVGGLSELQRVPKAGGMAEDIDAAAGLTALNLGYEMLIDGDDIYTINNSGGTTGRIFRISSDGGATWAVLDAVTFPTAPADDFRAAEAYGGRIYLLTHEGTGFIDTEVWSFPAGVATATTARLETSFGDSNCSGLAVDDTFFYAACGTGERLVRVDRATGAVTLLTTQFNLSGTNNSMYGVDFDSDGATDVLYLQTWFEEGYFVCDPGQAAPFFGDHFDFGTGSSSYGMGYDQSRTLYTFDDDTDDIVVIE